MTIARALVLIACALGIALSQKATFLIAFLLCAGLSVTLSTAAIWGFITGEYVGLQVYAVLAMTLMGTVMWGHMLVSEKEG